MRRAFVLACLAMAVLPARAADSTYTKVNFDADCKPVSADETGGTWTCKGYREWRVHFSEGDIRQSAFYGYVGEWFENGAFESFGHFNHAGDTIEWRIESGIPYATIRRWFVQSSPDNDGSQPDVQVLVVAKVGQKGVGEACVVGYVEATANPNANALARQVADTYAKDFTCRVDTPQWHGARENEEVQESRYFGE